MADNILSFKKAIDQALRNSTSKDPRPHLLLGNGFSRACRDDIFAYGSLLEKADFQKLSHNARRAFDALKTSDFEEVMRALKEASALIRLYSKDHYQITKTMLDDAAGLKEILLKTIVEHHPERPSDISSDSYKSCRQFLKCFKDIYTVNYDLLLYWACMNDEDGEPLAFDDGFRRPAEGGSEYVTWEIENTSHQNIHYLHGALHIFDAETEIKKFTWVNTGVPLIEQIRDALSKDMFPLIVTEGTSAQKKRKLLHSSFLSRGERSFANISGSLFVYGFAMSDNDEHILRLLEKGKIAELYVGIYGNSKSQENKIIMSKALSLKAIRHVKRPLEVLFYNAASARVWG